MAKLDYSADSAPLPPSSLVPQIWTDLTDVSCAPTANPATLANDATCPTTQVFIG